MYSATTSECLELDRTIGPYAKHGGHRDAFKNGRHETPYILRGKLQCSKPLSLEQSERRGGLFFVTPVSICS